MSETAIIVATRADESSKAAHKRLDRINGSLDRIDSRLDLIFTRLGTVDTKLARDDGVEQGSQIVHASVLDRSRFVIGLAVTFICSSVFALLLTLVWRPHT